MIREGGVAGLARYTKYDIFSTSRLARHWGWRERFLAHSAKEAGSAELLPCPTQPANERCREPECPREHEEAIPPDGDRNADRAWKRAIGPG